MPVWQVEQAPLTVTPWALSCAHLVGVQPVVPWQLKQLALPTGMWLVDLPVAVLPLWQPRQLVLALKPL